MTTEILIFDSPIYERMPRRTVLFTPGNKPDLLRKAADSGADTVVFDLEDAVHPSRTDEAIRTVTEFLESVSSAPGPELCVRLNGGDDGRAELRSFVRDGVAAKLDSVMVPKATSASDVDRITASVPDNYGSISVLALIETARGVLSAPEVAATDRTDALVLGAEDFAADVSARRTREGTEIQYARQRVIVSAAASGVDAIDTVYTDYSDKDGLREEATFANDLGFDGKLAIHPSQVDVIERAFTPSTDDVEWARKVLAAREEVDGGVFSVDGQMIDAPLLDRAEDILDRAGERDD